MHKLCHNTICNVWPGIWEVYQFSLLVFSTISSPHQDLLMSILVYDWNQRVCYHMQSYRFPLIDLWNIFVGKWIFFTWSMLLLFQWYFKFSNSFLISNSLVRHCLLAIFSSLSFPITIISCMYTRRTVTPLDYEGLMNKVWSLLFRLYPINGIICLFLLP